MSEATKAMTQEDLPEEPGEPADSAPEPLAEDTQDPYATLNEEELRATLIEMTAAHAAAIQATEDLAVQKAATEVEMQRMAADFQNARKRLDRLAQEQVDRATQRFAAKILAVLDDLELALANSPAAIADSHQSWLQGIEQIHAKIGKVMGEAGVTPIKATGAFDPGRHEAVQQLESADHESGEIVDTVRTGYMFKEQVLRPAMVRIAS